MNADLPENPSAYTSMSGVAQAFSQTLSDTRELSGPLAGLPVPADLTPLTCTWLASMSRSAERSTVAPAAGELDDVAAARLEESAVEGLARCRGRRAGVGVASVRRHEQVRG